MNSDGLIEVFILDDYDDREVVSAIYDDMKREIIFNAEKYPTKWMKLETFLNDLYIPKEHLLEIISRM